MKSQMSITTDRLRKLIDDCGKTKKEIAASEALQNCDVSTITKHYNGDREVNSDFIVRYAKYFNVSTDYLLGLSDAATSDKDVQYICDYTGLSIKSIEVIKMLRNTCDLINFNISSQHAWIGEDVVIKELYDIVNAFIERGYFSELMAVVYDYNHAIETTTNIRETIVEDMKRTIDYYSTGKTDDSIPVYFDAWELHELSDNCNEIKLHYFELQEIPKSFVREYCKEKKEEFDRIEKEHKRTQKILHRLDKEEKHKHEGDHNGKDQEKK